MCSTSTPLRQLNALDIPDQVTRDERMDLDRWITPRIRSSTMRMKICMR
jgi:hypothetical protein